MRSTPLTQREVYEILHSEVALRLSFRNMFPDGKSVEQCSREAHLYAVKHTWHWFNNQKEFVSYLHFNKVSTVPPSWGVFP